MADLDITVQQVGAPLGSLTLAATAKQILATLQNRLTATIELVAVDPAAPETPVDFLWSTSAAGTYSRAVPGPLRLPVQDAQSWYVKEGETAGALLYVRCAG